MARLFTVASDETLIEMIRIATERLVIVAPGLSQIVAQALAVRLQEDGGPIDLSVTLDTDPEICRFGYGEIETLELLHSALASVGRMLQTQSGVRIGLVVADGDVLVYSPTPQLIEAGSTSEEKPNAIRISGASPQELAFVCGASETSVLGHIQEVGLDAVTEEAVVQAKADLAANPPRKFDLVRLETVFNYKLEFVEFSIEGYRLNARVVTLPPMILGFVEKDLKERLRNTVRLFEGGVPFTFPITDPDDDSVAIEVNEKWFADEARNLREFYIISLGSSSYGSLIQKRLKPEFLRKVDRFKKVLAAYALLVRKDMETKIQETRGSLLKSLLPGMVASPPPEWKAASLFDTLTPEKIESRLESVVDQAFKKVDQSFSPKVVCIFKGVRYETIVEDEDFIKRLVEYFGEEEIAHLLSVHEASRAEDPTPA
jgi:hypothetical protein